jgi:mRNA interferase HigB
MQFPGKECKDLGYSAKIRIVHRILSLFAVKAFYIENYSLFGNFSLDIYLGTYNINNVHIVKRKILIDFYTTHKETKSPLDVWYYEAKNSNLNNPIEIKEKYRTASIIGGNKVVFNIKGNKYRLVTKINYQTKTVYIKFIGTHKEYDNINVEEL